MARRSGRPQEQKQLVSKTQPTQLRGDIRDRGPELVLDLEPPSPLSLGVSGVLRPAHRRRLRFPDKAKAVQDCVEALFSKRSTVQRGRKETPARTKIVQGWRNVAVRNAEEASGMCREGAAHLLGVTVL